VEHPNDSHQHAQDESGSLTRSAVQATLHCLTGCAIGEVLGMVLATALGWGNTASIAISIALAFVFGYAFTIQPVLRAGVGPRRAVGVALAGDTVSISTMEIIDNAFVLLVPGALAAGLSDGLFWWSLAVGLVIAFVVTVPVNRWLISRGRGHAVMHELHAHY
jgi:putative flippase GtrA